eukprot:snap_masked-scaffold_1-processed-gene-12.31-mRNA-1 protein AED:1.00 eAED:1.00 QI:0/-1/0/0/-1/1/1/0/64
MKKKNSWFKQATTLNIHLTLIIPFLTYFEHQLAKDFCFPKTRRKKQLVGWLSNEEQKSKTLNIF